MSDKQKSVLKRFLLFILLFAIVCLVGITNIFALEKTIYSGNNEGTLSSANTYRYGYISGGVQQVSTASINTTVNGVAIAFMFYYYEPVNLNYTYTMEINFMSSDLLKSFNSSMVHVYSCNSDVCNPVSIVSVTKNNNTGNSNKLTVEFNPISVGTYVYTNLSNSASATAITGVSTFGIKNVNLTYVNANQDIINNQTNNTNNIINNNNSNTQEIIDNQNSNASAIQDTINDNFNTIVQCPNLFDISKVISNSNSQLINNGNNLTINAPNGSTAVQGGTPNKLSNYCPNCVIGETYILSADSTGTFKQIYLGTSRTYWTFNTSKTLTQDDLNSIVYWYASGINTSATISNIQIEKGNTSSSYCVYGSSSSVNKLDEQTNAINDLNSNLTDDSPVDMNSLGNVAGWLPPGPIDSIINLPLSMLNALYSAMQGTCASLHIPIPYLNNKYLDIPCISAIFNQIEGLPTFWTWVGVITSTIMLYKYLLSLYKYYDDLTTLQANFISDFGGAP